ncbi:hypothetical protein RQ765_21435 [Roseomonas mucosa]|uniref:type IVB secretion system protein IcmW n=1 Tax=Roseomonas mucosa TaxID=207340 RepID=UPI0028CDF924|nr:hypothetical protein [Roseomonas mucosa]MDT8362874.1 hypothetical protein [Roseomonas mucosa]
MPDLERHAVLDWLRLAEPATTALASGLVRPIEVTEAVEPLLVGLGQRLDSYPDPSSAASLLTVGDLAPLREVLAQLGIARLLRLLTWLDAAGTTPEGRLPDALLRDESTEAGLSLRAMLATLHRQALLDRLFARERLEHLATLLDDTRQEAA